MDFRFNTSSTHVVEEIPSHFTGIQDESSRLCILRLRQADRNPLVDGSSQNLLEDRSDIISNLHGRPPISLEDRQRIAEIRTQLFDPNAHHSSADVAVGTVVPVNDNQDIILSSGLSNSFFDPNFLGPLSRPTIISFPVEPIITEDEASVFAELLIQSAAIAEDFIFPIPSNITDTNPNLRSSTDVVVGQIRMGVREITNSAAVLEFYRRQVDFVYRPPQEEFADFRFFPYEVAVFATFMLLPKPVLIIILAQMAAATSYGSHFLVTVIYQLLRPLLLTVVPSQYWARLSVRTIVETTRRLLEAAAHRALTNLPNLPRVPFYRRIPNRSSAYSLLVNARNIFEGVRQRLRVYRDGIFAQIGSRQSFWVGSFISAGVFAIRTLIANPNLFRAVFDNIPAARGFVGQVNDVLRNVLTQANQGLRIGDLGPDVHEDIVRGALYILREFFF